MKNKITPAKQLEGNLKSHMLFKKILPPVIASEFNTLRPPIKVLYKLFKDGKLTT